MRRPDRIISAEPDTQTTVKTWPEYRAHVCPAAMVGSDMVAFLLSMLLSFSLAGALGRSPYGRAWENMAALGTAWHGWGSLLVLACLLCYFGGRGHYTSRVPSWTVCGDVVVASAVALACDAFLT